jgi:hypothetical protein
MIACILEFLSLIEKSGIEDEIDILTDKPFDMAVGYLGGIAL